jgi:hypothetical protein
MSREDRLRLAQTGGYIIAAAGLVAAIAIGLFFSIGQPWGTLNDLALLVMTLALAPVMLGAYELGGRTPLMPARLSLASGLGAIILWSLVQVAMVAGVVSFDYGAPATGSFAISSVLEIAIGAWLIGAPLLAGPWLPTIHRLVGTLSGIGWVLLGLGLLLGGVNHPLTYIGGIGYQLLFPVWGLLMGRRFGILRSQAGH